MTGALALLGNAHAQSDTVRAYVRGTLTYSDNADAGLAAGNGGWRVEVAPGVSVLRNSGRLRGNLNAQLRNVLHLDESGRNDSFVALNGHGMFEAVEDTLFIDMDASMSRNNRSAFSGRFAGDQLDTASANETRMFGIGPRLHFRLGPETSGSASYMTRWLTGGGNLDSRRESVANAQLANPVQFGRIGWGLAYSRTEATSGRAGRTGASSEEIGRATLYATVTPQFRLRGIVGHERNDYELAEGDSGSIVGGGFDWNPTDRTRISGTTEKRVFGRGYDFQFNHRHALSNWNLSYSRDITSSLEALGVDVFQDPEFRLLYDALAQVFPDPFLREAIVRQLLGFPPIGSRDSFFTTARFVRRNLTGSVSLIGARNVLTFVAQQSERTRLGAAVATDPSDDFARFDNVKTRSASVSLSHRLAPQTSLNTTVTRSRSTSDGGAAGRETRRTLLNVGLSKQLGPNTSGALTYTYQRSEGFSAFTENVVSATISVSF